MNKSPRRGRRSEIVAARVRPSGRHAPAAEEDSTERRRIVMLRSVEGEREIGGNRRAEEGDGGDRAR